MRTATTTIILQIVCEIYGVDEPALLGGNKGPAIFEARAVAMALLRRHTSLTQQALATLFQRKDHTTIQHALRRAETFLAEFREAQQCQRRVRAVLSPETAPVGRVAGLGSRPGGSAALSRSRRAA